MVDAGGGCIGWGARDRDLMRGTVLPIPTLGIFNEAQTITTTTTTREKLFRTVFEDFSK